MNTNIVEKEKNPIGNLTGRLVLNGRPVVAGDFLRDGDNLVYVYRYGQFDQYGPRTYAVWLQSGYTNEIRAGDELKRTRVRHKEYDSFMVVPQDSDDYLVIHKGSGRITARSEDETNAQKVAKAINNVHYSPESRDTLSVMRGYTYNNRFSIGKYTMIKDGDSWRIEQSGITLCYSGRETDALQVLDALNESHRTKKMVDEETRQAVLDQRYKRDWPKDQLDSFQQRPFRLI